MPLNLFIFTRDLNIRDNTTLIELSKKYKDITPIFIFNPVQIEPKKNKYFSNNSVEFMIESLFELNMRCDITYFYGDPIKVLNSLHKQFTIASIGINYDYSPFAISRLQNIIDFSNKNNIDVISKEHYMLFPILEEETLKEDGTPYLIYTPYRNHLVNNLQVRKPDPYKAFNFVVPKGIKQNEYYFDFKNAKDFYEYNDKINVRGGRKPALKILANIGKFKNYDKCRNMVNYKTTQLSAYNKFSTVSIREVYWAIRTALGKKTGLINELIWRQFYYELCYRFPQTLRGQISDKRNAALIPKFDKIKWSYSKKMFDAWCTGSTGQPLVDSAMRQLNTTGYIQNRARMATAVYAIKNLHLDWRLCEKYYGSKLVDYDPMINNGSWQWSSSTSYSSLDWYQVFNLWTQAKKYDPNCEYIKHWLPELKDIPNEDIFTWYESYKKYPNVYMKPIVDHETTRKETLKMYMKALKS